MIFEWLDVYFVSSVLILLHFGIQNYDLRKELKARDRWEKDAWRLIESLMAKLYGPLTDADQSANVPSE